MSIIFLPLPQITTVGKQSGSSRWDEGPLVILVIMFTFMPLIRVDFNVHTKQ